MLNSQNTPGEYQVRLEKAVELYDREEYEKCVAQSKYDLSDRSLPPYYVIKYCMLIAYAVDDWDDGNIWRLAAENTYDLALEKATRKNDQASLAVLAGLKEELEELNDCRLEDVTGIKKDDIIVTSGDMEMEYLEDALAEADMYEDDMYFEDEQAVAEAEAENEDLAGMEFEDAAAVAEAEAELLTSMDISEDQAVAEAEAENETVAGMDLEDATAVAQAEDDIMSTAEPPIIKVDEVPDTIKPPSKSARLRRQKSARFNKGGAFHAQQFSRSRSTSKLRASVLDIDWTPKDPAK